MYPIKYTCGYGAIIISDQGNTLRNCFYSVYVKEKVMSVRETTLLQ